MRTLALISSAIGLLALSGARGALAAPDRGLEDGGELPTLSVHFFDEERPLTLDLRRIAALRDDVGGAQAIGGMEGEAFGIPGWSLLRTPEGRRSAAEALRLVEQTEALAGVAFAAPVFVGEDGGPLIPSERILVRFHGWVGRERAEGILRRTLGEVVDERQADAEGLAALASGFGGDELAYNVRTVGRNGFETLAMANELAAMPETVYAEPDMLFTGYSTLIPNDTFWSNQWGLDNQGQSGGTADMDMDAPEAWDITTGGSGIITVIFDTGVDPTHPDLNLRLPGVDTTSESGSGEPINECDNHGTWVAGCISSIIDNSLGVVGIAPTTRTASARPFISTIPCDGSWSSAASWTVDALTWAESIGARVTNNSNGYGFTSSAIADKYSATRSAGMVHFASAGNSGGSSPGYPAILPSLVSVSALDRNGDLASFSNTGADISAPGVTIGTTDRVGGDGTVSGDFVNVNGTSFASPYTAGVAALVLSAAPWLTAEEVEQILQETAVDLGVAGFDATFGAGFVNAFSAVTAAQASNCPEDLNGDGVVGAADLATLLGAWGPDGGEADLSDDGEVGATDLAVLLGGWGPC